MPSTKGLIWDIRKRSIYSSDSNFTRTNFLGSKDFIQRLGLETTLEVHEGSVNSLCWNETGEFLLSGSEDGNLVVTNPYSREVKTVVKSRHLSSIQSAQFMPQTGGHVVVSSAADGQIFFTNITKGPSAATQTQYHCHVGAAYKILTVPSDPHSFLSCGEDGTIRWFDVRNSASCNLNNCKQDVLIDCRRAVTSMAVSPSEPFFLAAGCSDGSVRIYDRRMLGTPATGCHSGSGASGMTARFLPAHLTELTNRVTSLCYSPDGCQLLASYASDYLYLFDPRDDSGRLLKGLTQGPKCQPRQPSAKRLRLRGDWSDTGPLARPESERDGDSRSEVTLLQRISDMMSRWFEEASEGQVGRPQAAALTPVTPRDQTPQGEGVSLEAEPVVSRHLGTQGTSASSIHLGWTGPGQTQNPPQGVGAGRVGSRGVEEEEETAQGQPRPSWGSGDVVSLFHRFNLRGSAVGERVLRRSAAAHIQEIFRRRRERRELEESETRRLGRPAAHTVFRGHRNSRTLTKEACFWGDRFVLSGSDCGHVFVWDRKGEGPLGGERPYGAELVMLLEADQHVVNCLQPHPYEPMLATSGIDNNIKLWSPTERRPAFDRQLAQELLCRNEVMLEETRNTITVPASFMLRMLASLNRAFRPDQAEVEGSGAEIEEEE
ncbi:unnamed protein product [Boreogadus saida]